MRVDVTLFVMEPIINEILFMLSDADLYINIIEKLRIVFNEVG